MNEKEHILNQLKDEFNRWEGLLASLSVEQITEPYLPANLSIKDVVSHLWAWQQRSIARMEAGLKDQEPQFPHWPEDLNPDSEDDLDKINAWIYANNHEKSWEKVHADWKAGYLRFLELGQAIPEEDLLAPGNYTWLWGHPLSFILLASYDHHHNEHYEPLVAWLRQNKDLSEN